MESWFSSYEHCLFLQKNKGLALHASGVHANEQANPHTHK